MVMGILDSLQGLLIVVGGRYVPGIMQNLLLQGIQPIGLHSFNQVMALKSERVTCES